MWRFGLLGLASYGLYFLALLLIVLLLLWKLLAAIWPWLLVVSVTVTIFALIWRNCRTQ